MDEAWISHGTDNQKLWSHEWVKHGTCTKELPGSSGPVTQEAYFAASLNLRQEFQLNRIFIALGLTPSYSDTYAAADLQNAFKSHYGVEADFMYQKVLGDFVLTEVRICLDLKLTPQTCGENMVHEGEKVNPADRVKIVPFYSYERST
eukprot:CAMPEP_0114980550 /NCGR_PEP_ID=MMETSP0216-20121206/5033_1 /TAXON_ID=223996 /ORGANISM="Protocruzia adherens, Strain Boccale" /LENGTH=147 /DNA_ID=CAMNT_0002342087 /DNA_START=231 /DNA_END=674 /DNA_ORIENTATION=-